MEPSISQDERIVPAEYRGVFTERWSPAKLFHLLAVFGPAAIVASVAIGAGETIVVVQAGSWAGYDLLWLVLLSVLVKGVFVTYLLGRYTAVSGEPMSQRLARLPGPRGWLLIALVLLEMAATGPLWAAVARPCGDLLHYLLISEPSMLWAVGNRVLIERIFTTVFIAAAVVLSLYLSYEKLEMQQVLICGILVVGTVIGTLMVRPDYVAAIKGSLSFGSVPDFPLWAPASAREHPRLALATTFGYVGGSVLGYIVYANWISLHGWGLTSHPQIDEIRRRAAAGRPADYLPVDPTLIQRILRSIAPLKWDVGCGAIVLWMVSASFMMAGAAVLYPRLKSGELEAVFTGWSLLTDQAYIWRNVHASLIWVYYVCVLLALWGTLQAFPEIYTRVIVDFGKAVWPARRWARWRVQAVVSTYIIVSSSLVVWSELKFDTLTHVVAFLTTNLAVALAMVAALYLNFQLPPAYRTRWWMLVGGVFSATVLLVISLLSGIGVWRELVAALDWR
ncbi:MAG: Nramp family divalent metal transporter [Planctomycetales bacterium]|nr:Nramp family divalent metal transporter [Planctomycetales bacterium]